MSWDLDTESLDRPTPATLRAAVSGADPSTSDTIPETFIFVVVCVLLVFCLSFLSLIVP